MFIIIMCGNDNAELKDCILLFFVSDLALKINFTWC